MPVFPRPFINDLKKFETKKSSKRKNIILHRNMYKFHYLAFLDVDEMIIPKKNASGW